MKLIPSEGRNTANYWCSWRNQRLFMPNPFLHMRLYDAPKHNKIQRDMLTDDFLFGKRGLLVDYMQDIRQDMYVMLDDGWDIPYKDDYMAYGSLVLNEEKFPYQGKHPAENLATLNKKITDLGYAGTALWVPLNCIGEEDENLFNLEQFKEYWTERAKWINYAGIAYLKVDWGYHQWETDYREALTDIIRKYAPHTLIEHAIVDGWSYEPNQDQQKLADLLSISDAYRCYDVRFDFNAVTTLGRASEMLTLDCDMRQDCKGFVNIGEEPYVAAALGCTMGIMSHPLLRGSIISMIPDDFENGISHRATLKSEYHSFDNYMRAIRWQRIAPATGFKKGETLCSEKWLTDSWTYEKEPYPYSLDSVKGKTFTQTAPQIVARGTYLPEIAKADGEYEPYIAASVNSQTGVYTIATLPRTIDKVMNCTIPPVDVTGRGLSADKCFGVFGVYNSLTLEFDRNIEGMRLFGGDILLDEHNDITDVDGINIKGTSLTIDGKLISKIGLECATFHDIAEPGCIFKLV